MVSVEVVARGSEGQLPGTVHCWDITDGKSLIMDIRLNKRSILQDFSRLRISNSDTGIIEYALKVKDVIIQSAKR